VERRQRRMIKNRESAARSRARKQVCMLFSSISCSLCVIDRLDVL
jgi:ABA responsive element binding factor